ncbi:MAG TPA: DUF1453 domain-containing protein [Lysobacter sp.]
MPLLLLVPLLLMALVALWALLLPLALLQRYRLGKARRRAIGWIVRLNAWLLLVSVGVFALSAWLVGHWVDAALLHATAGLGAGILVGIAGLALTRFEREPRGLYYTPNRWLVLGLTVIVAVRIGAGVLRGWQLWRADAQALTWLSQQGSLLAVGGLLLGYYLAYGWGLRGRLRPA